MNNKIFLIGFMGCGKTTLGQLLSKQLNFAFIDTDLEVEREAGKNITEIFKNEGESFFRKAETVVLEKILLMNGNLVVASGGGTPCFNNNIKKMLQTGTVIYLSCRADVITERINKDFDRPLLESSTNLLADINKMLSKRELFYRKAHIIIDVSEKSPKEIASELLNACSKIGI
jgi:shikimate kinase